MRRGKHLIKVLALLLSAMTLLCACQAKPNTGVQLSPKNPTSIIVWHYYNGLQKIAFEQLVQQFNETVGKETGIYVEEHSQGSVHDLESNVLASFDKKVGSSEVPDIFSSYADTAYAIEQKGMLVDLEQYLTKEELDEYVDSFIEEGRIGKNGELRIFPVAKSSEVFMLNKNAWEAFAQATGATLDQLATKEGVTRTAQAYYEWTDSLTPDVPYDGQAFFGRDAMANLFIVGSMQFGVELFRVENGQVTLQIDRNVMRSIWDNYYVPFVKGYFATYGRFRSDDVKLGEIVGYVGSTSSANYFPNTVETAEGSKEIGHLILPTPIFENAVQRYAVQQGAGMVVTKSTPERELASVIFLKWFTQNENNLIFSCTSGYVPVKKAALNHQMLDETIQANSIDIVPKTYGAIATCIDTMPSETLYTNKAFEHGAAARAVLENHLADKATSDREIVKERLASGMSLEEAVAEFVSDEAFEKWLQDFSQALHEAVEAN